MDDAVSTLIERPAVGGLTTGAVARLLGVAPLRELENPAKILIVTSFTE
ncbi:hypothetical protein I3W98_39695, partial [Streptomyces cavourensis]|nr:hypothetical protein [Streptomyces cavourensis]